jgi:hypothetical protein
VRIRSFEPTCRLAGHEAGRTHLLGTAETLLFVGTMDTHASEAAVRTTFTIVTGEGCSVAVQSML